MTPNMDRSKGGYYIMSMQTFWPLRFNSFYTDLKQFPALCSPFLPIIKALVYIILEKYLKIPEEL